MHTRSLTHAVQLDLDTQLQRALNYEAYEQAQELRAKRQKVCACLHASLSLCVCVCVHVCVCACAFLSAYVCGWWGEGGADDEIALILSDVSVCERPRTPIYASHTHIWSTAHRPCLLYSCACLPSPHM